MVRRVDAKELKRYLKKRGCRFDSTRGKGSHIMVIRGGRQTILPMHSGKGLSAGLVNGILKDLGLKR